MKSELQVPTTIHSVTATTHNLYTLRSHSLLGTYLNGLGHLKDVFNKRQDEFLKFFACCLVDHVDDRLQGRRQHLGTLQFAFHGGQYVLAPQFLYRSKGERKKESKKVYEKWQFRLCSHWPQLGGEEKALINLLAPESPRR